MNKRLICVLIAVCFVLTVVLSACTTTEPRLSVSFDRTHTVYEGDTLDSLKEYLTVKYTDSNGNRTTVTNYTLSGNLDLGENKITVKHRGLSASFSVTVESKPQIEDTKGSLANPYSVAEALQLTLALEANAHSVVPVHVKGIVYSEVVKGTINDDIKFDIIDDGGEDLFTIYYATLPATIASNVEEGDTVVVYGYLYMYVNDDSTVRIPEMADYNGLDCTIISVQKGQNTGTVTISISTENATIEAGAFTEISISTTPARYKNDVELELLQGEEFGYLEGNVFNAVAAGQCVIVGRIGDIVSNQLVLNVTRKSTSLNVTITLSVNKTFIEKNYYTDMTVNVSPSSYEDQVQYRFIQGGDCVTRYGLSLRGDSGGIVKVQAYIEDCVSNIVSFQVVDPDDDPYTNTNSNWFHTYDYSPADSLEDAYWRTQHNLMSGSIDDQDQKPTTATSQPKSGNLFVRNTDDNYIDNGNTWEVVDSQGKVVNKIYKFGAYVTLEDVAAYVYAFGDVPANYTSSNKTSSLNGSPWGKFLRLNHNYFSGNTSSYPYEPALPRISGVSNGDLRYYEIDIGTTGTDCDPSYDAVVYNNGSRIVRGAARIVYSRYYRDGSSDGEHIDNLEERYVFYTYNHYNDFQEYLNYQGGWGQIFGNVTGGGTISSKTDYNPTPYVSVSRKSFNSLFR